MVVDFAAKNLYTKDIDKFGGFGMKVNIYYGGRGLLDDPTLYVIDKMQEVLVELRVTVDRHIRRQG